MNVNQERFGQKAISFHSDLSNIYTIITSCQVEFQPTKLAKLSYLHLQLIKRINIKYKYTISTELFLIISSLMPIILLTSPFKLILVNLQSSICQVENCVADGSRF